MEETYATKAWVFVANDAKRREYMADLWRKQGCVPGKPVSAMVQDIIGRVLHSPHLNDEGRAWLTAMLLVGWP